MLIASIIGGLAGDFYAGIMNVYAYGFVNPGLAALPAYLSPDGTLTNLINGILTCLIAFGVAFAIVFIRPFEDRPEEEVGRIVAETDDD